VQASYPLEFEAGPWLPRVNIILYSISSAGFCRGMACGLCNSDLPRGFVHEADSLSMVGYSSNPVASERAGINSSLARLWIMHAVGVFANGPCASQKILCGLTGGKGKAQSNPGLRLHFAAIHVVRLESPLLHG
jgi:hypothetical protein